LRHIKRGGEEQALWIARRDAELTRHCGFDGTALAQPLPRYIYEDSYGR
jgi:hypothetical protein